MATATELPPGFGDLLRPHSSLRFKRCRGKRVRWASADQLCKIRMFVAEDAPSLAGVAQERLQVKTSKFMHDACDLPPGFGGGGVTSCLKVDTEKITALVCATTPWRCPQKLLLDATWHVGGGEESSEIELQKQRESKVLEAVYPRASVIPDSPWEAAEICSVVSDSMIPIIPVTSPDEDSDSDDKPSPSSSSSSSQGAAVSNGTVNLMSYEVKDEASLIDPNLLLQFLSNPSLVEALTSVQNNSIANTIAAITQTTTITSSTTTSTSSIAASYGNYVPSSPSPSPSLPTSATPFPYRQQMSYMQNGGTSSSSSAVAVSSSSSSSCSPSTSLTCVESSSKVRRVCAYFNTIKGCRNGLKCPFVHDGKRPPPPPHHHQQHLAKKMRG